MLEVGADLGRGKSIGKIIRKFAMFIRQPSTHAREQLQVQIELRGKVWAGCGQTSQNWSVCTWYLK